jgi:hypothetical protein
MHVFFKVGKSISLKEMEEKEKNWLSFQYNKDVEKSRLPPAAARFFAALFWLLVI